MRYSVLVLALSFGCSSVGLIPTDVGLQVVGGAEQYAQCPVYVHTDSTVPPEAIERAMDLYNDDLGFDFFIASGAFDAEIIVGMRDLPLGSSPEIDFDYWGSGSRVYSEFSRRSSEYGELRFCSIRLSRYYFQEPRTHVEDEFMVRSIAYNLGRCVGLGADMGPPQSVDTRSLVSNPIDPLGRLTNRDHTLLSDMCNGGE